MSNIIGEVEEEIGYKIQKMIQDKLLNIVRLKSMFGDVKEDQIMRWDVYNHLENVTVENIIDLISDTIEEL